MANIASWDVITRSQSAKIATSTKKTAHIQCGSAKKGRFSVFPLPKNPTSEHAYDTIDLPIGASKISWRKMRGYAKS